jgi:hypothetical protein
VPEAEAQEAGETRVTPPRTEDEPGAAEVAPELLSTAVPSPGARRWPSVGLTVGLAVSAFVVFSSIVLLAVVHAADRYQVNHVSGTWMALARDAADGTLYRPLYEDGFFGGTFYMPLQIVLHAGLSEITGEELVSGRLLAYVIALALCGLTLGLLRSTQCAWIPSLALLAAVAVTPTGQLALLGIRGDALPLVLQLAAIGVIVRWRSRRALIAAALFCALALTAKLTAVWAPIAIALWLLGRSRRSTLLFAGMVVLASAVFVGVFEFASSGRLSDNVLGLLRGGDGSSSGTPLAGVSTLFELMPSKAGAVWILLPAALVACLLGATRRLSIFQIALLVELVVVAAVLRDSGSDYNHLIDLAVLTALVVGELWGRGIPAAGSPVAPYTVATAIVAVALVLGTVQSYVESMRGDVTSALRTATGQGGEDYGLEPLAAYVDGEQTLLSEDPVIPLMLDQRPILIDAIAVRRLGRSHPEWVDALRDRIEAHEFDAIALLHPVEDEGWFADSTFGSDIRDAIAAGYRLEARLDRPPLVYWLYRPG